MVTSSASRRHLIPLLTCASVVAFAVSCVSERSAPTNPVALIEFRASEGTSLRFDVNPVDGSILFDLLGQLWTLPSEGGEARPLTYAVRDLAEDTDPAISPDGRYVIFKADRPGGLGLWLLSLDGDSLRRLTTEPGWNRTDVFPAWSRDGREFAFVRANLLVRMELASGTVDTVRIDGLPSPWVRDPQWSPDGTRIVFVNANRFAWGRVWEVPASGGQAVPLTPEDVPVRSPVYSPDGSTLAMFVNDSAHGVQVWIEGGERADLRRLTDHAGMHPGHLRWSRDGRALLYSAEGRLWRLGVDASGDHEIPFGASVRFERRTRSPTPVTFPEPGDRLPARGYRGLAISPDGERLALIALGSLWVGAIDATPERVTDVPPTAQGLAWSPDGRELAWSAGPFGGADLWVTEVTSGRTRRLTSLPGDATRPSWSPDGRHVAFVHWLAPALDTLPWLVNEPYRLRLVPASGEPVGNLDQAPVVADLPSSWGGAQEQERPQWSPDGEALLVFGEEFIDYLGTSRVATRWVSLSGESRELPALPDGARFLSLGSDGALTFVRANLIWRMQLQPDSGMVGEPALLSEELASYPRVARDGTVLYQGAEGLRLLRPDRAPLDLGWPLQLDVPEPAGLVLRNVRRLEGDSVPAEPVDIHVRRGRIAAIVPADSEASPPEARVVDGEGRIVIPGLINLHTHLWDPAILTELYYGVTTIRDMGSPLARTAAYRDEVTAGLRPGPRIVFGGLWLGRDTPIDDGSARPSLVLTDSASAHRQVLLLKAFGGTHAKHRLPGPQDGRWISVSISSGLSTSGHIATSLPILAAGLHGKEHLGQSGDRSDGPAFYSDVVQLYRAAGIYVVPTHAAMWSPVLFAEDPSLVDRPDTEPFLSPYLRWFALVRAGPGRAAFWRPRTRWARDGTRKLHEAGVPIGAGTDAPVLPWGMHLELEELVAAGLTPGEAIAAATSVAARILGAEAEIGTIEEGKWADLLILNGDPLEDIRNTRKIWNVIQRGQVVDREALVTARER